MKKDVFWWFTKISLVIAIWYLIFAGILFLSKRLAYLKIANILSEKDESMGLNYIATFGSTLSQEIYYFFLGSVLLFVWLFIWSQIFDRWSKRFSRKKFFYSFFCFLLLLLVLFLEFIYSYNIFIEAFNMITSKK